MDEEKEIKWLNSKGYSIVKVKCAKCGKMFEAVVATVRKDSALKHDTFFCQDCSLQDEINKDEAYR